MTGGAETISVLCVGNSRSGERIASSLERADDRFAVTVASGVRGGLDALADGEFDCVVSDHDPSGTDGLAFLEAVRRDRPSLPFVLFTADGDEAVASEAISAGVTDYVREEGAESYETLARRVLDAVDRFRSERRATPAAPDVPGDHPSGLRDVTGQARIAEQRRADHDALKRMYRITADAEAPFEEKMRKLLELGTDYLDVPYGFLTRIEDGMQTFVHAVGDHELIHSDESGPLSETYCRKTVDADELVAVRDAVAEGWAGDTAFERYDFGCYIGAEVVVDGDLYGTFCFAGSDPREEAFSHGEKAFVELMSRWVSYELERLRYTRELQNQTKRLDEFASMVSHDLRNPLSVAGGYLELAREDGDPEQFDRIEAALGRMDRIIGDLLYLARENEQIRATETVDLDEAVRSAWETVNGAGREATLEIEGDLGVVTADPNRLSQLLENVFRNAVEHGSTGNQTRSGNAVEQTGSALRVVPTADGFAVEDDGPGIPPEERDEVFEQGYTTHREGTGFGLAIVKQIADGHGWTVSITDSEMGGARFEIGDVR